MLGSIIRWDVIFGALLGSLIGMFVAGLGKTVMHIDLSSEIAADPSE